jgi:hypothetical protein
MNEVEIFGNKTIAESNEDCRKDCLEQGQQGIRAN